jgi:hypothetical protein
MTTTVTDIDLDTGYKLADCEVIEDLTAEIEWELYVTETPHKATTAIKVHRIDLSYTVVTSTIVSHATHDDPEEWHDERETVTLAAINGNNGWAIEADEIECRIGGDVFPAKLQIEVGEKKAWVTF